MKHTKTPAFTFISSKNNRGFTLIELLVGISIISIVFSIGVANYRDFSRRESLNGISKQLKGDLRTAQQLALSGKKPDTGTCNVLNGYTFALNGANGYRISANCSNGAGGDILIEHKLVDLGSDVSISSTNPTIDFKVLGQGTSLTTSNIYTLSHISGMQTTIEVGVGGDVK